MADEEKLTTRELADNLRRIREDMAKQGEAMAEHLRVRHRANSELQKGFIQIGLTAEQQNDRIGTIERNVIEVAADIKDLRESMSPFADLAKDLKFRLLGDPVMQTEGLVEDHKKLKESIEQRLSAIQKSSEDNGKVAEKVKIEQRAIFVALAALGSIITWAQATGFFGFLSHKP